MRARPREASRRRPAMARWPAMRDHPPTPRRCEEPGARRSAMATTLIKRADWVIAWQAQPGRHVYMRDIDVAFDGGTITYVGKDYAGEVATIVDGTQRMVMPGLVNLHSHPEHEPAYRGVGEEHGLPNMYMSGLFERSQAFFATDDAFRAATAE